MATALTEEEKKGLFKPPRSKSDVWKTFALHPKYPNRALCSLCHRWLSYSTSTSNLTNHLKSVHSQAGKLTNTMTTVPSNVNGALFTCPEVTKDFIDQSMLRWLIRDMRPLTLSAGRGFTDFVKGLVPNWQPPSRRTLMRRLDAVFKSTLQKLSSKLTAATTLAITTDTWTSAATQSYVAVTVHFIDASFQLHSNCLTVRQAPLEHSGVNMARVIQDVCTEYNVMNKLVACASDNASNMVCTVDILNVDHLRCFGHTLQLCANGALNEVGELVASARKIAAYFHRSTKRVARLHKFQVASQRKKQNIPTDCITRWSSTWKLLECLVRNRPSIVAAYASDETVQTCPFSDKDWESAALIAQLLEPIHKATTLLSGSKYATLSLVPPLVIQLRRKYDVVPRREPPLIKGMRTKLLAELKERLDPFTDAQLLACVLDPRFVDLPFLTVKDKQRAYTLLKKAASAAPRCASTCSPPTKGQKEQSNLESVLGLEQKNGDDTTRYLAQSAVSADCNPLQWWQSHQAKFASLAPLARQYLAYPATSVPCERTFSHSGYVVSKLRTRLTPDSVERLVFLYENQDVMDSDETSNCPSRCPSQCKK